MRRGDMAPQSGSASSHEAQAAIPSRDKILLLFTEFALWVIPTNLSPWLWINLYKTPPIKA